MLIRELSYLFCACFCFDWSVRNDVNFNAYSDFLLCAHEAQSSARWGILSLKDRTLVTAFGEQTAKKQHIQAKQSRKRLNRWYLSLPFALKKLFFSRLGVFVRLHPPYRDECRNPHKYFAFSRAYIRPIGTNVGTRTKTLRGRFLYFNNAAKRRKPLGRVCHFFPARAGLSLRH